MPHCCIHSLVAVAQVVTLASCPFPRAALPSCPQSYMKNLRKEKAAHLLLRGFLFGHCLTGAWHGTFPPANTGAPHHGAPALHLPRLRRRTHLAVALATMHRASLS